MAIATGRTAAWDKVGGVYVYVSAKNSPSDADWAEYLRWLVDTAQDNPIRTELLSIVLDRSSGPNAAQRRMLNDATIQWKLRVAVLTPSTMARGIVTAMNWFKKDAYEAFSPEDFDRAVVFLGVGRSIGAEVRQTINALADALDASWVGR